MRLEVGEVDLLSRHELADLNGLSACDLRLRQILVRDDDELPLGVLVALLDILPRDFNALGAADAFVLNRRVVLLVKLTEGDLGLTLRGRIEAHRNRDQSERYCTLPDWPWHRIPPKGCRQGVRPPPSVSVSAGSVYPRKPCPQAGYQYTAHRWRHSPCMNGTSGRGSTEGVANAVLRSDVSCRRADRRCAGTVWDRRHRKSDRLGPVPHRSRLDRRAHDRRSPGAPVTASYFPVQNTGD